jgi:hypothetical protein
VISATRPANRESSRRRFKGQAVLAIGTRDDDPALAASSGNAAAVVAPAPIATTRRMVMSP